MMRNQGKKEPRVWGKMREGQTEEESMAPVFFCIHLFRVQVELYSLSSACASRGQEEREGKRKSGETGGGAGMGGLSVISPEGDNGRRAHCNGCRVVPSLCTISQSGASSARQKDT